MANTQSSYNPPNWVLTNPNPKYKVYTALLSQTGTDALTAIVLENTIGDIVWTIEDTVGGTLSIVGTLEDAFTINKTIIFSGGIPSTQATVPYYDNLPNQIIIDVNNEELTNFTLEIRIYN